MYTHYVHSQQLTSHVTLQVFMSQIVGPRGHPLLWEISQEIPPVDMGLGGHGKHPSPPSAHPFESAERQLDCTFNIPTDSNG